MKNSGTYTKVKKASPLAYEALKKTIAELREDPKTSLPIARIECNSSLYALLKALPELDTKAEKIALKFGTPWNPLLIKGFGALLGIPCIEIAEQKELFRIIREER